jgi:hypothetical protein
MSRCPAAVDVVCAAPFVGLVLLEARTSTSYSPHRIAGSVDASGVVHALLVRLLLVQGAGRLRHGSVSVSSRAA